MDRSASGLPASCCDPPASSYAGASTAAGVDSAGLVASMYAGGDTVARSSWTSDSSCCKYAAEPVVAECGPPAGDVARVPEGSWGSVSMSTEGMMGSSSRRFLTMSPGRRWRRRYQQTARGKKTAARPPTMPPTMGPSGVWTA
jgi:hypothetical protein